MMLATPQTEQEAIVAQPEPEQQPATETMTLQDLLIEIDSASAVMSKSNPHRQTLRKALSALVFLHNNVQALAQALQTIQEKEIQAKQEKRIITLD